jgi:glycosyltransferase involved in cell wall biosynthesis
VSFSGPDVSVVFETENEKPNHRIRLTDVMEAWLRQTGRSRVAEWIIVSPRRASPEEAEILRKAPARWIERPATRYYGLKNEGIRQARGRFIALADADALPADDWLERALEVFEESHPTVALVTGRSRFLPGPFSRELAIAQLPNQADRPEDTTHFLAHNVLLHANIVRPLLFSGDEIRLGPDAHLAARLLEAGFQLRYDPSLRVTHNYSRRWTEIYRHCVVVGYAYGRFQRHMGEPHESPLRDFVGRMRLLVARWRRFRRPLGISFWRLPISLFFFTAYCTAVGHGLEGAYRDNPEPFARF